MYEYRMTPQRVIDGDSIVAQVNLGLNVHKVEYLRLAGIDAPELNSSDPLIREKAQAAKAFLDDLLFNGPGGRVFIVRTEKPYSTDKYGRWLGNIVAIDLDATLTNINELMISSGYAVSYSGGAR